MKKEAVKCVFNLCESVDEDPTLIWHPAAVLELLGFSFSGSPSAALMLTSDKVLTKRLLKAWDIRTPRFVADDGGQEINPTGLRFPVIVKPRFEDASIGIDQESIFEDERSLINELDTFRARFGPILVEEYIDGREFNISLFGYPAAKVLPMAEIDFSAFPKNFYTIVGYRAKWDEGSFEYHHTPRTFPERLPQGLRNRLKKTVLDSYILFQLRDYGRVDLRLDDHGNVYVLEINANPCLSPDAGLAAAYQRSGSDYVQLIGELVDFTTKRIKQDARSGSCCSRQKEDFKSSETEGYLQSEGNSGCHGGVARGSRTP
jgi:D-alanine-D-alanine ligase